MGGIVFSRLVILSYVYTSYNTYITYYQYNTRK